MGFVKLFNEATSIHFIISDINMYNTENPLLFNSFVLFEIGYQYFACQGKYFITRDHSVCLLNNYYKFPWGAFV